MHLHLVLFILPMLFGFIQGEDDQCPNASAIQPCKCKSYFDGACIITCSLSSQKIIERIADIPNLCSGHVHFVLVHSIIDGIPARLWKTLLSSKTVDISIKHAKIQGLVPAGEEIPKVYTPGPAVIKIDHSRVSNFDWKVLRNFYSEEELTLVIDDTPLEALSPDFSLIAEGQVHKVTVDSVGLTTVPDKLFVPFEDLNSLSLQNNKLTSVSRSMVAKPAKQLQFLALNGNLLSTLPSDMFSDMPLLEVVYMRDNKFTTLPQDIFQNANSYKLQRFDFSHNPWECDCRLLWILSNTKYFVNMGLCATPDSLKDKNVRDLSTLLKC